MADAHPPVQDATPDDLRAAVAANHRAYFALCAATTGGVLREDDGVTWIDPGPGGTPVILFPTLTPADAGPATDRLIQQLRARDVAGLVGWWSLDPPRPTDLEVRLLARGFQIGWRPHWMARDLDQPLPERPLPAGVRIALLDDAPPQDGADLPYYDAAAAAIDGALSRQHPRRVWAFGAWDGARLVGRAVLCCSDGPLGVAGLYGVGVAPAARRQGIGAALTAAACRHGREQGYRYAVLNATGDGAPVYERLSFTHLGDGRTWWLNVARLAANPPAPERIALAEAVGRGDLAVLRALGSRLPASTWDQPLPNGMTLLQLAAHTGQHAVAAWLVDHAGATLDVTPGWALGWHDRVAAALQARPELANRRIGEQQTTPLHDAVQQDDVRLVRLLLAAGPDVALPDGTFQATALGWARHLGRTELVQLIEAHATRSCCRREAPMSESLPGESATPPDDHPLRAALRALALRFPEAHEEYPWGQVVVKVQKKVFVFLDGDPAAADLRFSLKLPVSGPDVLSLPFAAPAGYGLGKWGWVAFHLEAGELLPLDLLEGWVAESYRAVAPKRLLTGVALPGDSLPHADRRAAETHADAE